MKMTSLNSAKINVYLEGVKQSPGHNDVKEAIEHAVNVAETNRGKRVTYKYEDAAGKPYEVLVEPTPVSSTVPPVVVPPVVTPPAAGVRRLFAPDSFANKALIQNAKLLPNSAALRSNLVKQTIDTQHGGTAFGFPNIAMDQYSIPFFIVTDPNTPKVKITVENPGAPGAKTGTALYKQMQAEPFRVPANLAGAAGTDGACVVWDQVDDTIVEAWGLRNEGGVWKMSWGAKYSDVSNHPGFIARLASGERQGSRACGVCLPMGVARFDEVMNGKINHPVSIVLAFVKAGAYQAPATDTDGWDSTSPDAIMEGQLIRLPASWVAPSNMVPIAKMYFEAIRDFGGYVIDKTNYNVGLQLEDILHLAPTPLPAPFKSAYEWAWAQYAPLFAGQYAYNFLRPTSQGGQAPWELCEFVQYPVVAA